MAVARWLETDSLSNQNISSALAIGAYTADADRMIVCDVSIDQAAGGGDYVVYLTRQINGAGSAYVMLPKTTCTAAAGETAIAMQSGAVTVRSGDVLTVYLDGLAGDTTTPDTTVRWFEMATLRPATADRQLTVAATGEASANVTHWSGAAAPDAPPSKAELDAGLLALQGADGDTLETLSDQIDDVATAADVWAYATRTLTEGSTSTTDVTASGSITRKRGNSWSISLALGSIASYTSLWFTIKRSYDDADSASLLQVKLNSPSANDGLLYVNGAAASNAALGSITVSDANTGAIVIAVDETITDDLSPGTYYYDAQALIDGDVTTPDSGTFTITADVTRSVL